MVHLPQLFTAYNGNITGENIYFGVKQMEVFGLFISLSQISQVL